MFAYVLIGLELIILYAAFWFVFVREPKPFELKENLWGYYSDQEGESLRKLLQEQGAHPQVKRTRRCRPSHSAPQRLHVEDREGTGWVYAGKKHSTKKPQSMVANLLGVLGQELTRLSTKLT
ncbi:MAG: hypothetical protein IPG59_05200 [Candidatus Melainabacteria bacterium]|nr:MAG: hypothetical protein IPG59_05200 [Candidatus Melainabacteria bacterium]